MKVLQTLGRHGGAQEGIFQYSRDKNGVNLDLSIGQATTANKTFVFTSTEWQQLLTHIGKMPLKTFCITTPTSPSPNQQVLYEELEKALPAPGHGQGWHPSVKAAVVAVMEHEGSLDLYHGPLGPKKAVSIILSRA
ncbi:hypothetical protein [Comamonas kerstersii]|uniref:hypothetical protein n=1 Tax=Comamonas kerstersii TaxID=225992 RepID=UPI001B333356|nr:hypothetical protein [Comamonas kerstersii]QTW17820.1 hypothetical protein H8N02_11260 [Comamonas kerstersii]